MSSDSGLELARFFVNEFHSFLTGLQEKLNHMEGTVGNGKPKRPAKKAKRAPNAFNLFVAQEIAKSRELGTAAPEGKREGGWYMANAAKKWGTLTTEQKKAFAESKREFLGHPAKVAVEGSSPPTDAAAEEEAPEASVPQAVVEAPTTEKKKKKKKRDRLSEVGIADDEAATIGSDGEKKKKKKKKLLPPSTVPDADDA